jgi:long-chain acyl-CoA synthetase
MLVQEFLERSADRNPGKVALICDGRRLAYEQVEAHANRLANALIDGGIQRGDRIVLFLPNCVKAVIGIFAVLKAGGVFVAVNHTTKAEKLGHILRNCRASAILTSVRLAETIGDLCNQVPSLRQIIVTESG